MLGALLVGLRKRAARAELCYTDLLLCSRFQLVEEGLNFSWCASGNANYPVFVLERLISAHQMLLVLESCEGGLVQVPLRLLHLHLSCSETIINDNQNTAKPIYMSN